LGVDTPNLSGGSVKTMNPRTSNNDYFDQARFRRAYRALGNSSPQILFRPELDNYKYVAREEHSDCLERRH
jgi:hypothetical protein